MTDVDKSTRFLIKVEHAALLLVETQVYKFIKLAIGFPRNTPVFSFLSPSHLRVEF